MFILSNRILHRRGQNSGVTDPWLTMAANPDTGPAVTKHCDRKVKQPAQGYKARKWYSCSATQTNRPESVPPQFYNIIQFKESLCVQKN